MTEKHGKIDGKFNFDPYVSDIERIRLKFFTCCHCHIIINLALKVF